MSDASRKPRAKHVLLCLAFLTALAFALRVIGARSSIAYSTDSDVVRQTMLLGHRIVAGDLEAVRSVMASKYPLTLCYYLLGVYSVLLPGAWLAGLLPSVDAVRDFAFSQRDLIHLVAVYAFAAVGAALIPLTYFASRSLDGRHVGWVAAGFAACNALLVHFGHQPRPHVPLATFGLLSLMLLVRVARGAPSPWPLAATIASAFTLGVHQIGAAIVPTFALAWLLRILRRRSPNVVGEAVSHVALFAVLCLVVYPGLAGEMEGVVKAYAGGEPRFQLGSGAHHFASEDFQARGFLRFAASIYRYQPFLALSAPVGFLYLVKKLRGEPEILLLGFSFFLAVAIPIGSLSWSSPRMAAALIPLLILAAAHLVEDTAIAVARRTNLRRATVLVPLGLVVLIPSFVTACRLVYVTSQRDTRTLAREWIESHVAADEAVLANFRVNELSPSAESLRSQAADAAQSLGHFRRWLLSREDRQRPVEPRFQLLDYAGVWPAERTAQEQFVRDRRIRWAIFQVRFWRRIAESNEISEYLGTHGDLADVICPGRGLPTIEWPERSPDGAQGTYLPEDVETEVWRHVWSVERPGPIVLIFEVAGSPKRSEARLPDVDSFCG